MGKGGIVRAESFYLWSIFILFSPYSVLLYFLLFSQWQHWQKPNRSHRIYSPSIQTREAFMLFCEAGERLFGWMLAIYESRKNWFQYKLEKIDFLGRYRRKRRSNIFIGRRRRERKEGKNLNFASFELNTFSLSLRVHRERAFPIKNDKNKTNFSIAWICTIWDFTLRESGGMPRMNNIFMAQFMNDD